MKIRLDKFLASQLNISRNDAKKLIKKHAVKINSSVALKPEIAIDTDKDVVYFEGQRIQFAEHIYIMMNKPAGVVSSTDDNRDITVIDILPDSLKRNGLFPAGRLDKDTTGFMLITDDGEFAHNILSPSHHVVKTYVVTVENLLTSEQVNRFLEGMKVSKDKFKPAELKLLENSTAVKYEIRITEGKYHQIKRMFSAVGNPVIKLHRTAIGGLKLDDTLMPGDARLLSENEVKDIIGL